MKSSTLTVFALFAGATAGAASEAGAARVGPALALFSPARGADIPGPSQPEAGERAGAAELARLHEAWFRSGRLGSLKEHFSPAFFEAVPADTLELQIAGWQLRYGRIRSVRPRGTSRKNGFFPQGALLFHAAVSDDRRAALRVALDARGRIAGWFLGEPVPVTAAAIQKELQGLEGEVSACARIFGEAEPAFAFRKDAVLPIASAFKLYVLAELLRQVEAGTLRLDAIVTLEERLFSIPSGDLHDWPAGAPITLHTLAALMISKSDNTATDHVLALVGREAIETRLGSHYPNSAPERNRPFLSTREAFLLRGSGDKYESLRKRYLEGGLKEKRIVLEELREAFPGPFPSDGSPGAKWADRIEWFATAADLVALMEALHGTQLFEKRETHEALRGILAINPGVADSDGAPYVTYLGFKGGSETAGILNLTQVVETGSGARFAVSASWHRPGSSLETARLAKIVEGIRALVLARIEGGKRSR